MVARGAADSNPRSLLTCGPTNARIVEVAVAVELGDADSAIARGRDLRIPPGFAPVRASHHHIDMARPLLWAGHKEQALKSLLTAERYAPEQTRHNPVVHDTVGVLVQIERRCPDTLLGLMERIKRVGATFPLR
jgi:hypothetical protein